VESTINRPKEISIAFMDVLLLAEFRAYWGEKFRSSTVRLEWLAERPKLWTNFRCTGLGQKT
jgi:hypothetical protein